MEKIVIQVKDKKKAQALKNFLQTLILSICHPVWQSQKRRQVNMPISFHGRLVGRALFRRKASERSLFTANMILLDMNILVDRILCTKMGYKAL